MDVLSLFLAYVLLDNMYINTECANGMCTSICINSKHMHTINNTPDLDKFLNLKNYVMTFKANFLFTK